MSSERVLVLGGRGLIGSTLTRDLVNSGALVIGVDSERAASSIPDWRAAAYQWRTSLCGKSEQVKGDVRDESLIGELMTEFQPISVVFLAALLASEARSDPDEAQQVQVDALRSVIARCTAAEQPPHLVLASSSYVYGHFDDRLGSEDARRTPIDTYGRCKAIAEDLLTESGLPWTILRPAAVYGIGDPRQRFVSLSIEAAAADREVVVDYPDFSADFTHVDDVARAFAMVIGHSAAYGETFNVTREEPMTNEAIIAVLQALRPDLKFTVTPGEIPDYVPRRGRIDCSRIRQKLDWHARIGFDEGVAREYQNAVMLRAGSAPDIGLV